MVDPTATAGPSTAVSLQRSRDFLAQRLEPDLREAYAAVARLQQEQRDWIDGARQLRALQRGPQRAELGEGVSVDVIVAEDGALPRVDLGLPGTQMYAELSPEEGSDFCDRRAALVLPKLRRAEERVAEIEAHLHLAAQSIAQLEALQSGENRSVIDGLNLP